MTQSYENFINGLGDRLLHEDAWRDIEKIAKNHTAGSVSLKDGRVKVDAFSASALVAVYNALNNSNKKKFIEVINSGQDGLQQMLQFAFDSVNSTGKIKESIIIHEINIDALWQKFLKKIKMREFDRSEQARKKDIKKSAQRWNKLAGISDSVELDEGRKYDYDIIADAILKSKKLKRNATQKDILKAIDDQLTKTGLARTPTQGAWYMRDRDFLSDVISIVKKGLKESVEEVDESRMSELHMLIKQGKSAEQIAKIMKVDVKTIKELMKGFNEMNDAKESYLDEAWTADSVTRNAEIGSKKGYGINIKKTGGVTKTPHKHMLMTMQKHKNVRVTFDHGKDEFEGTPQSVALYINKKLGIKESITEMQRVSSFKKGDKVEIADKSNKHNGQSGTITQLVKKTASVKLDKGGKTIIVKTISLWQNS